MNRTRPQNPADRLPPAQTFACHHPKTADCHHSETTARLHLKTADCLHSENVAFCTGGPERGKRAGLAGAGSIARKKTGVSSPDRRIRKRRRFLSSFWCLTENRMNRGYGTTGESTAFSPSQRLPVFSCGRRNSLRPHAAKNGFTKGLSSHPERWRTGRE